MPALSQRFLRLAASITAGTATLAAGHAQAVTCTFGAISANSCSAFSVGALTFSNFTRAAGSGDDQDTFTVTLLPNNEYLLANNYSPGASAYLMGNGNIGFKVTTNAANYNLLSVSGNSDTSNGGTPFFTFTNTLSGNLNSPFTSAGTPFGPGLFTSNTQTSNVVISWVQGDTNNFGVSSSLRLKTDPLAPPMGVPAPLPLLGAGGAFAFSRRLRRRLHQARLN
jgi:hypothetical protein